MTRKNTICNYLSVTLLHVRESKKSRILDSRRVDSLFQVLHSSLCQWNLDSRFQSLIGFQSKSQASGFHKQKFPGLWNTESLTWGDTYICVLLPLCAPVHPGLTVTFWSLHCSIQEENVWRTLIFISLPMFKEVGTTNVSVLFFLRLRLQSKEMVFHNKLIRSYLP